MAENSTIEWTDATAKAVEAAYRSLTRERHPDRPGGSHDMMADLNRAREQGMKARGGGNAQG